MPIRRKPRALDLFCGAGGASMGLYRAGFAVTGVDINLQVRYPFTFIQADALEFPLDGFDLIWASPPCQRYSKYSRNLGTSVQHPDLVAPIRNRLLTTGTPWIIENVPGAPLRVDVILCGTMFGLPLLRHRHFEGTFSSLILTPNCNHQGNEIPVYGGGTTPYHRKKLGRTIKVCEKRIAMQIDWMSLYELSQAVPPVYAEFLSRHFLRR